MNDEAQIWIDYARDNLETAKLCLDSGLINPALQNAQQCVEKSLKSLCLQTGLPVKKTHSIAGLCRDLSQHGVDAGLDDEACELFDAIYLPSKYPLGSALPDFMPDAGIAGRCLALAERMFEIAVQFSG